MTRQGSTRRMIQISMFAVLGFLFMYFIEFPLPFFPPYLKYDPSEIPALIAAFAFGPLAGLVVEFLKGFLFFISGKSTSGIIGVAAAFVAGGSFAFVAGFIYKKMKTKKGAAISLLVGTLMMTVVMSMANYFVFLPLWGIDQVEILGAVMTMIVPFNIVKGLISSIVTFLLYKRVHKLIH